MDSIPQKKMKRSKSLDSVVESERIEDKSYIGDDSGVQSVDGFVSLERKVDRLKDMCMEQTRVLTELTQHVRSAFRAAVPNQGCPTNTTVPQECFTNATVPQGCFTNATVPQGCFTNATEPQGCFTNATEPQGCFTNTTEPQGCFTDTTVPQGSSTDADVPHQRSTSAEVAHQFQSVGDVGLAAVLAELLQKIVERATGDGGARSLLSAIEARPGLERRVGDALTALLQSEELKQRIVASTTASIKELITSLFSVEVSSLYVPIMERAHHQLLRHVTKLVAAAFADLEENTVCNAEALRQTSQSLQAALQRHQALLQEACDGTSRLVDAVASTTEKVIERELKQWREDMSNALPPAISECGSGRVESPSPVSECTSPEEGPSPSDSPNDTNNGTAGLSPVDRMMITAEVNKLIKDGEISEAFKRALQAMDLSVVVAACRAAAPLLAGGGSPLSPPLLLSLLQQLATDLLLDTPVKCSYIEYALLNINPLEPAARAHLPLVVGELRRHLGGFLRNYPHHAQARRIAAIMDHARDFV